VKYAYLGLREFYESITEALESIFNKTGEEVAFSLSNPTSKMFWKGLDLKIAI